ncbi:MAG: TIGR03943 family putative permease subunit [Rhodoglobus sp.]
MRRWWGVILILSACSAAVWLGATGQLVLYIHPRYVLFTVVMAAIALVLGLASIAVRPASADEPPQPRGWAGVAALVAVVLSAGVAVSLIVVPPTTLTSATASQRDIVGSTVGSDRHSIDDISGADDAMISEFTVVDWASLLRQTSDPSFYADKTAQLVGFITASTDDPQNMFYLSRFTVTCCAVDAQPSGVAVYVPNWSTEFAVDSWVQVTGTFATNPSARSELALVLMPDKLSAVERPREPYLY